MAILEMEGHNLIQSIRVQLIHILDKLNSKEDIDPNMRLCLEEAIYTKIEIEPVKGILDTLQGKWSEVFMTFTMQDILQMLLLTKNSQKDPTLIDISIQFLHDLVHAHSTQGNINAIYCKYRSCIHLISSKEAGAYSSCISDIYTFYHIHRWEKFKESFPSIPLLYGSLATFISILNDILCLVPKEKQGNEISTIPRKKIMRDIDRIIVPIPENKEQTFEQLDMILQIKDKSIYESMGGNDHILTLIELLQKRYAVVPSDITSIDSLYVHTLDKDKAILDAFDTLYDAIRKQIEYQSNYESILNKKKYTEATNIIEGIKGMLTLDEKPNKKDIDILIENVPLHITQEEKDALDDLILLADEKNYDDILQSICLLSDIVSILN